MIDHHQHEAQLNEAQQAIGRFAAQFGEPHRLLAMHGALPLALTPELVGFIRNRFLRGEAPWIAEADLLLSELCQPAGESVYVMQPAIRALLLAELRRDERFGLPRMQAVARLLLQYVAQLARSEHFTGHDELQAQQWAAMVYLDDYRPKAAHQLAEAFGVLEHAAPETPPGAGRPALRRAIGRLANLTLTLSPEIGDYPELVAYAGDVRRLLADSSGRVAAGLRRRDRLDQPVHVMDVRLPPLALLAPAERLPEARPTAAAHRRHTILLADPSQEFRHSLSRFLHITGELKVVEAADFSEARRLLENVQVDLVLTELRLTDETDEHDYSGFELATVAHEHGVPVMILTAYPSIEATRMALHSRPGELPLADDVLSKADGPVRLLNAVTTMIDAPIARIKAQGDEQPRPLRDWRSTILHVDPDYDYRHAVLNHLEMGGYQVKQASSLRQAQQLLESTPIDLLLTEIRLTDTNDSNDYSGLELARVAGQHAVPVIVLTAFPSAEVTRIALGSRPNGTKLAYDVVLKENGLQALLATVNATFDGGTSIRLLHLAGLLLHDGKQAEQNLAALERDLHQALRVRRVDYAVVAGDVTQTAARQEFAAATAFIENLARDMACPLSHVIIVPGNHDSVWPDQPTQPIIIAPGNHDVLTSRRPVRADGPLPFPGFVNFALFQRALLSRGSADSPEQANLYRFPNQRILFLGLDSTRWVDDQGGHHSSEQRKALAEGLATLSEATETFKGWLRIAVCHDSLGIAGGKNAQRQLRKLADAGFTLLLYGDRATGAASRALSERGDRGIFCLGAGSGHAGGPKENIAAASAYNLLELNPANRSLVVHARVRDVRGGSAEWHSNPSQGEDSSYNIKLKGWSGPSHANRNVDSR